MVRVSSSFLSALALAASVGAQQVDWIPGRAAQNPPRRWNQALSYDEARQRIVLFGGIDAGVGWPGTLADTWECDGVAWTRRMPPLSPPARCGHALAYDSARQRIVLFGGASGVWSSPSADTWEWNGNQWTQVFPATSPSARSGHAMAYDVARRQVVLFGGQDAQYSPLGDTWSWDGSAWTRLATAVSPPAQAWHSMAYDSMRARIVLNGDSTWEWDGIAWKWRAATWSEGSIAYDALRQRTVVFFPGCDECSVWIPPATFEWDGTNWQWMATQHNYGSGVYWPLVLVWHAALQRVVGFNGQSNWLYGPLTPAKSQVVGTACRGSNGLPLLSSGEPFLGNPAFSLDLQSVRPLSTCCFLLADREQNLPLLGGCSAYVGGAILPLPAPSNAAGQATLWFALPLDITLRGVPVVAQAFVVDPLGPMGGLTFSAGRRLILGD